MNSKVRSICELGFAEINTEDKSAKAKASHRPEGSVVLTEAQASVLKVLSERWKRSVHTLLTAQGNGSFGVEELRFRIAKPAQVLTGGGEIILKDCGSFEEKDAEELLHSICENSVYAKEKELQRGFVTLRGGARVGICGEPVVEGGRVEHFRRIYAFNIRIPREVKGCAEKSIELLKENGQLRSSLIISPPGVGKTTFLRDCARCLSDGIAGKPLKVAVVDERGELTGGTSCLPLLDVGSRTDSMIGVPKIIAFPMLVRNMSPNVIITDELEGEAELMAVSEAVKCGVAVIASAHAGCGAELLGRRGFLQVLKAGLIRAHLLTRGGNRLILSPPLEI